MVCVLCVLSKRKRWGSFIEKNSRWDEKLQKVIVCMG